MERQTFKRMKIFDVTIFLFIKNRKSREKLWKYHMLIYVACGNRCFGV